MKKMILMPVLLLAAVLWTAPVFAADAPSADKLDEVLKNQEQILRELGEIKKELNIVKIRASD